MTSAEAESRLKAANEHIAKLQRELAIERARDKIIAVAQAEGFEYADIVPGIDTARVTNVRQAVAAVAEQYPNLVGRPPGTPPPGPRRPAADPATVEDLIRTGRYSGHIRM
jgi:hypothetical protein